MEFILWAGGALLLLLLAGKIRGRSKPRDPVPGDGAWADAAEQVIRCLTAGSRQLPDRIVIAADSIWGIWSWGTETFQLTEAGFPSLPDVEASFHPEPDDGLEESCYVDNPQVRLAREMNSRLGGRYRIYDGADRHMWVDDEGKLWVRYRSTQVELIQKKQR